MFSFIECIFFSKHKRIYNIILVHKTEKDRDVGWWCGCGHTGEGLEADAGRVGGAGGWHDTLCMYGRFFIELSAMYVIGSVHKWGCVI